MKKEPRQAALAFIFVTVLLDVIGFGIIIPIIPDLIMMLSGKGISEAAIIGGWLMFVYAAVQFFFAPIIGGLSDRFGRRPVLLLSLAGFGIDYLIAGFAPTIGWLFVARFIAGITGASMTTASAYIADVSPPEKRAQNFGLIGAAFGLGFIIGPVIGGILGEYGPQVPFFAAAGLAFINLLYGYFILPESLPKEKRRAFNLKRANPLGSFKQIKAFPLVGGLFLVFFLLNLGQSATQATWTYFTMEKFAWDQKMVGYSLGIVGICVAIVQGGLTRIVIPKIGESRAVIVGLFFTIAGLLGIAFSPTGFVVLLFILPYSLGGFTQPAIQGIMANRTEDSQQGELQGIFTGLMSLTTIFGPPLMSGLFGYFTSPASSLYFPGSSFTMGAILCVFAMLIAIRTLRVLRLSVAT